MEKTFKNAEELTASVKEYLENRVDELKIGFVEKTSAIISNVLAGILIAVIFSFFVILGSIGLALWLGSELENAWLGFLLVAGFYLVFGLIVWLIRGTIIRRPVMNTLIRQLFKNDDDNDQ